MDKASLHTGLDEIFPAVAEKMPRLIVPFDDDNFNLILIDDNDHAVALSCCDGFINL